MIDDPQKRELLRLINHGLPFDIEVKKKVRQPGLLGFFKPMKTVTETKNLLIKEPTLYKLDRIALELLNVNVEELETSDDFKRYLKRNRHFRTMARILAIAIAQNKEEEDELEDVFFKTLKPSDVKFLVDTTDLASNMPDFIISILSVTAVKTERMEKQELPEQKPPTDKED